jgi:hypothetical protein
MSARSFKSVGWVAAVGAAALGCYMVSLNVASERNELAKVEREILLAKRDIRALQTELGTRGRLQQLETWNAEVLALSAPMPGQFIDSPVRLASLDVPQQTIDQRAAQVQLASVEPVEHVPAKPAVAFRPATDAVADKPVVHKASMVVPPKSPLAGVKPVEVKIAAAKPQPVKVEAPGPQPVKAKSSGKDLAKVAPASSKPGKAKTAIKTAPVKTAAAARPKSSAGLIDDGLLKEINAVAGKERKGAGGR